MKCLRIKSWLWGFFIALLISTVYFIGNTYAIFESDGDGYANITPASWEIELNDHDISKGVEETFVVDNFYYSKNDKVSDGYIAPGRNGYFVIVLKPKKVDVALRYDINLLLSGDLADNITFSVSPSVGDNTVKTGPSTYSGVLSLADISKGGTVEIIIGINWKNMEEFDENDTILGKELLSSIDFPTKVNISQYLGEEIVPYTE